MNNDYKAEADQSADDAEAKVMMAGSHLTLSKLKKSIGNYVFVVNVNVFCQSIFFKNVFAKSVCFFFRYIMRRRKE